MAPLDETELTLLMGFDGYHLVAVDEQGEVVGYLLSFPHNSRYDDAEFRWFRQNLVGHFIYICQVVVAQEHRQQRIGHAFYHNVLATARQRGSQILCCDINTNPPNLGSSALPPWARLCRDRFWPCLRRDRYCISGPNTLNRLGC